MTTVERSIADHLAQLGVTDQLLTPQQRSDLDENGYTVLPGVLGAEQIAAAKASLARISEAEGRMAGHEYTLCDDGAHRLHNLLDKDVVYDVFLTHPLILAAARHVLGDDFVLSMLNMRSQLPGQHRQKLHVDWYEGAAQGDYRVCNAIWALDPFTERNGATRVVPGSHRFANVPKQVMADPYEPYEGEVSVLAEPGDVIFFNSHLWHRGADNHDDVPRAGINSFFCRADQKPELDQNLLLSAETRARFSPAAHQILGLR
ncbi:phytanoyl-CoA dioxygenase family protein [Streptomyces sp. NPDC058964]|uniref:phytanoyl-CoA dioxygenase family protein n=1 Tax=Streptomyces sp. NPDC058964 TaxID=3346681 RepID=UPI0036A12918